MEVVLKLNVLQIKADTCCNITFQLEALTENTCMSKQTNNNEQYVFYVTKLMAYYRKGI